MRGQETLELRALGLAEELVDGERGEPGLAADLHRRGVVVHADAARGQVREVAADAAADVERAALAQQAAQVPPVGGLDVEKRASSGRRSGPRGVGCRRRKSCRRRERPRRAPYPGAALEHCARARVHHVGPRAAEDRPRPAPRRPRLVQGGLPEREAVGAGLPAVRGRAEQRVVQRRGGRHPRDPRRAVGQVHLAGARAGLRGDRRPAGRADVRAGRDGRAAPGQRALRAARVRQQLPDDHAGRRLHLPRQRPLVAEREVHVDPGVRPGAGHPVADRRGRRDPLATRTAATRRSPSWAGDPRARPDPRRGRAGRAGPGRRAARRHRAGTAPRSTSPRPRLDAAGTWWSTPPPGPTSTGPRCTAPTPGAPTPRARPRWPAPPASTASSSCTSPASTCSTGRSPRPYREDDPVAPLSRLRRLQGGGRPRRAGRRAPLPAPADVGGRRGPQLRAHDARARRARDRAHRRRRPDRPPHLRRRPRRGRRRRSCATGRRSATTTSPAAASPRRGPTSRARSIALGGRATSR